MQAYYPLTLFSTFSGRVSIDSRRLSEDKSSSDLTSPHRQSVQLPLERRLSTIYSPVEEVEQSPIPDVTITPASPGFAQLEHRRSGEERHHEKRTPSLDENGVSKVKKVQGEVKKAREVLKSGVHKGQVRISTMTRKIGQNVGRQRSVRLGRSVSSPGKQQPQSDHHDFMLSAKLHRLLRDAEPITIPSVVYPSTAAPQHTCITARSLVARSTATAAGAVSCSHEQQEK